MSYRDDVEALAQRCRSLELSLATTAEELADARRLLEEARARTRLPVLDNLSVAAPCKADWNDMTGDERVRFCARCDKNVYNLSGMTRAEAEALLVEKEGKLCVRYFRRADGTVLTADCPDGVRRRRRRRRVLAVTFGAAAAAAAGAATLCRGVVMMGAPAVRPAIETVDPPEPTPVPTLGEIAPPSRP
jgi:hypothetical protein